MSVPDTSCAPLEAPLVWSSTRSRIMVNGKHHFRIKGINWFGFETTDYVLHGLWQRPMSAYLDWAAAHGFNALRIPFSVKLALALDDTHPKQGQVCADPSLRGLSSGAVLDRLLEEAGRRGLLVMLDQHRLDDTVISELWYDSVYTEEQVLKSWDAMVGRYGGRWNLFALDLKNENHGPASWGDGERLTDWGLAAERLIRHIASRHPHFHGLFFVGGIWGSAGHWWGGNLRGVRTHPVCKGDAELEPRIVYTPHVYGPSVYLQSYFLSLSYPNNLPPIWHAHFGFIRQETERAVVVGEWGGFGRGRDMGFQRRLARYLRENDMPDNFYWCLNPNSGDTGGMLQDDWESPNWEKLRILHAINPEPSRIVEQADGSLRFNASVKPQVEPPPEQRRRFAPDGKCAVC